MPQTPQLQVNFSPREGTETEESLKRSIDSAPATHPSEVEDGIKPSGIDSHGCCHLPTRL